MKNKTQILIVLAAVMLLTPLLAEGQQFRATADRSEVALDGKFRLTYTLENLEAEDFRPPNFAGFQPRGPSRSSNMSWVNGKVTQSITYTYTVSPTKEGEFEIGPATVKVDGQVMKSNPVKIKVTPAGTASAPGSNPGNQNNGNRNADLDQQIRENLFVRAIPSKTSVYEGEQVTLTYKLFYALTLDDLNIKSMPNFDGFLSHEIDLGDAGSKRKVEQYNGRNFNTQPIHQSALFPSRNGTFTIEPMELTGAILVRQNDPGSFFPRTERIKYDFTSNGVTIEVKPLPASRPSTFNGAVGQFDFSAGYDKTETQVDDPITLKIRISGSGNLKLIDVPDLDFPQSFEVYDPKIKESISKKSYTVNGSKTFEYLIIPRGGGEFKLPDIKFTYFDPKQEKYLSRIASGPTVQVEGAALDPGFPGGGFGKEDVTLLGDDIKFIKTSKLIAAGSTANFITRPLFHVLTWLPVGMALFLPLIFRSRRRWKRDVIGMKSKKAHREAERRMAHAKKLMHEGQDREFYSEVVKSIWTYLADRFNVDQSDLSRSSVTNLLEARQVDTETTDQLLRLIDDCEMAVYAPGAVSSSKEEILQHASDLITGLDKAETGVS